MKRPTKYTKAIKSMHKPAKKAPVVTVVPYSSHNSVEKVKAALVAAPRQEPNTPEATEWHTVFEVRTESGATATLFELHAHLGLSAVVVRAKDGDVFVNRLADGDWKVFASQESKDDLSFKCPKCGGAEFVATQQVSGTIDVIAKVDVFRGANFVRNATMDNSVDVASLNFGNPYGPYCCANKDCLYEPNQDDFDAAKKAAGR